MLVTIKKLPATECTIEVCLSLSNQLLIRVIDVQISADSTVIFMKELVAKNMKIPVNQQKLVFKGKTMTDENSLKDYQITDGAKVHLFQVNGTDGSQSTTRHVNNDINKFYSQLSDALEKYYTKTDTIKIIEEFKKSLIADIEDMSLDDIERLAKLRLSQQ